MKLPLIAFILYIALVLIIVWGFISINAIKSKIRRKEDNHIRFCAGLNKMFANKWDSKNKKWKDEGQ